MVRSTSKKLQPFSLQRPESRVTVVWAKSGTAREVQLWTSSRASFSGSPSHFALKSATFYALKYSGSANCYIQTNLGECRQWVMRHPLRLLRFVDKCNN